MTRWRARTCVVIGGALGAVARHLVTTGLDRPEGWPLGTLAVNVVGSALLGWLVGGPLRHDDAPWWLSPGVGVGVLGGFTTFGALALQLIEAPDVAIVYGAVSVAAGLIGARVGMATAESIE